MKADVLSKELIDSANTLMYSLGKFTHAIADVKPAAEAWSATDVAEHLLILETMANRVLRGETIESTRPPDQKMPVIKTAMEDTDTKRFAPVAVCPSGIPGSLPAIIEGLRKQRELLGEMTGSADLSRACIAFKHPGLGTLTMMEWLYFTSLHTRRHTAQLDRIFERVAAHEKTE